MQWSPWLCGPGLDCLRSSRSNVTSHLCTGSRDFRAVSVCLFRLILKETHWYLPLPLQKPTVIVPSSHEAYMPNIRSLSTDTHKSRLLLLISQELSRCLDTRCLCDFLGLHIQILLTHTHLSLSRYGSGSSANGAPNCRNAWPCKKRCQIDIVCIEILFPLSPESTMTRLRQHVIHWLRQRLPSESTEETKENQPRARLP